MVIMSTGHTENLTSVALHIPYLNKFAWMARTHAYRFVQVLNVLALGPRSNEKYKREVADNLNRILYVQQRVMC